MLSRSRPRRSMGFSLLEMIVAMAILSMSLGMLYQATSGASRNVRTDEKYAYGVELARSLLADNSMVPEPDGISVFGETPGGFSWRVETAPIVFEEGVARPVALFEIMVSVAWADGRRAGQVVLHSVVGGYKAP